MEVNTATPLNGSTIETLIEHIENASTPGAVTNEDVAGALRQINGKQKDLVATRIIAFNGICATSNELNSKPDGTIWWVESAHKFVTVTAITTIGGHPAAVATDTIQAPDSLLNHQYQCAGEIFAVRVVNGGYALVKHLCADTPALKRALWFDDISVPTSLCYETQQPDGSTKISHTALPLASVPGKGGGIISWDDYARFDAVTRLFRELWMAVGGTYDAASDTYGINYGNVIGMVRGLSYQDAMLIYGECPRCFSVQAFMGYRGKALLPIETGYKIDGLRLFMNASNLEIITLRNGGSHSYTRMWRMFFGCTNLRYIRETIHISDPDRPATAISLLEMFTGCTSLETVYLWGLSPVNIPDLSDCPNLTLASLRYLVEHRVLNDQAVTVYVHQNVFDRLNDSSLSDWSQLANEAADTYNVSFAVK